MKSYICETCEQSFTTSFNLIRHKNTTRKHASHQSCNIIENVYLCEVCNKEYENIDEFTVHQKSCSYRSKRNINDASRSVLQSTTLAFIKVHDAVKTAFEEVYKAVLPLYQCDIEDDEEEPHDEGEMGVHARINHLLQVHSNFINDGIQRDVFILCDAIIKDIKSM